MDSLLRQVMTYKSQNSCWETKKNGGMTSEAGTGWMPGPGNREKKKYNFVNCDLQFTNIIYTDCCTNFKVAEYVVPSHRTVNVNFKYYRTDFIIEYVYTFLKIPTLQVTDLTFTSDYIFSLYFRVKVLNQYQFMWI